MNRYELAIYTEEKTVFEGEVEALVAPGAEGYLGVWANHAPLLTPLGPGDLQVRFSAQETKHFAVSGGFLEVAGNRAVILADAVEDPEEIDVERAKAARDRAEKRLSNPEPDMDVERARAALMRALNRIRVCEMSA